MAHCIHLHAVYINFRNINQLKLHCSFDSILFVTIVAVLDVDGVADKYSRKSNAHIMSSTWPSSKFSMTNAAQAPGSGTFDHHRYWNWNGTRLVRVVEIVPRRESHGVQSPNFYSCVILCHCTLAAV